MLYLASLSPRPTFDNVILPFARAANTFMEGAASLYIYCQVSAGAGLREASRKAGDLIDDSSLERRTRDDSFALISAVHRNTTLLEGLDGESRYPVERMYNERVKAGIGLEGRDRARFKEIQQTILTLASDLSANVSKSSSSGAGLWPSQAELDGVPSDVIRNDKQGTTEEEKGKSFVPLNNSFNVSRFCKDADVRERLFTATANMCNENRSSSSGTRRPGFSGFRATRPLTSRIR